MENNQQPMKNGFWEAGKCFSGKCDGEVGVVLIPNPYKEAANKRDPNNKHPDRYILDPFNDFKKIGALWFNEREGRIYLQGLVTLPGQQEKFVYCNPTTAPRPTAENPNPVKNPDAPVFNMVTKDKPGNQQPAQQTQQTQQQDDPFAVDINDINTESESEIF